MKSSDRIDEWNSRLSEQVARVKKVTDGLADADYAKDPQPGVWGIGQILAHLNLATEGYFQSMGAAISRGVEDKGSEPKHTLFAKMLLGSMHKPNIPVPGPMTPSGLRSQADLDTWLENSDRVLQMLEQSNGKDLVANKFPNPFFPIGKLNLADGFQIIVEHNERHIKQMEERIGQIRA